MLDKKIEEQNPLEKAVHNKLPYMIADYILANDLEDRFSERIYFTNHFISKDFVDKSDKASWAKCYKIYYLSQYYFDGLLLFEEPGTITYDEYDYQSTFKKPIEYNKKQNVIKPMILLTLQKIPHQYLLFVANCIGIPIEETDKMIREIKNNVQKEERAKQIESLRQHIQNVKEGISIISEYIGKDYENELDMLQGLSNDVEQYISDLEKQNEQSLILK